MRIKICGITDPEQGKSIAQMGATAIGFICVQQSPRYVTPEQIRAVVDDLPEGCTVDRVGVFANASIEEILQVVAIGRLNVVQLHSSESPEFCHRLRDACKNKFGIIELIKALRIRTEADLEQAEAYQTCVETLLLDTYHPGMLGGTGQTIDWSTLQTFRPMCNWLLAGGLTPDNVRDALRLTRPDGIDLSSGLEHSPGQKDLQKVARLFAELRPI
ncbi:phosphoribosylanthranilate isomerase [Leptolyngbya sp. GB1-A1]|uniref:phosphoribosylanthranilate isomerase n=1 Tax=Leptolyngbya sp. GB1-A1 TaxID=2933908 RepID=UPI00329A0A09